MIQFKHKLDPFHAIYDSKVVVHWRSAGVVATHFWALSYRDIDRPDIAAAIDRKAAEHINGPVEHDGDYLVRTLSTEPVNAPQIDEALAMSGVLHRVDTAEIRWYLDGYYPPWDESATPAYEALVPWTTECRFGSQSIDATAIGTPLQPSPVKPSGIASISPVLALFADSLGLAVWLAPTDEERHGLLSFNDRVVGKAMPLVNRPPR